MTQLQDKQVCSVDWREEGVQCSAKQNHHFIPSFREIITQEHTDTTVIDCDNVEDYSEEVGCCW